MDDATKQKLAADFPDSAWVKNSEGKSKLHPAYMIDRFNEVFGVSGWSMDTEVVDAKQGIVKGTLRVKGVINLERTAYGVNDGITGMDALNGALLEAMVNVGLQLGVGLDQLKSRTVPTPSNTHEIAQQKSQFTTMPVGRNVRTKGRPPIMPMAGGNPISPGPRMTPGVQRSSIASPSSRLTS